MLGLVRNAHHRDLMRADTRYLHYCELQDAVLACNHDWDAEQAAIRCRVDGP
jgi:hypothetical protein